MAKSMPRMREIYEQDVRPALREKFGYDNPMMIPKPVKIVVNVGVGRAIQEAKLLEAAVADVEAVTGQKAVKTKARKSISNFKLRQGMSIGCAVTLRREAMYEFFDRLVNVAIPRIRDFRGINPKSFDGRGNFNLGLREQLIFPEIEYDKIDKIRGMNISITTTARTDDEARQLLTEMGMPFRK